MKEISIEEQDQLCREKGWPTVTEQEQHWKRREKEANAINERIMEALEGILATMERMNDNIRLISSRL